MEQIKAWHLICELEAADLRILQNTPAQVSRHSEMAVKRILMLNNNNNNNNTENKKEEGEYDELDDSEEEEGEVQRSKNDSQRL